MNNRSKNIFHEVDKTICRCIPVQFDADLADFHHRNHTKLKMDIFDIMLVKTVNLNRKKSKTGFIKKSTRASKRGPCWLMDIGGESYYPRSVYIARWSLKRNNVGFEKVRHIYQSPYVAMKQSCLYVSSAKVITVASNKGKQQSSSPKHRQLQVPKVVVILEGTQRLAA